MFEHMMRERNYTYYAKHIEERQTLTPSSGFTRWRSSLFCTGSPMLSASTVLTAPKRHNSVAVTKVFDKRCWFISTSPTNTDMTYQKVQCLLFGHCMWMVETLPLLEIDELGSLFFDFVQFNSFNIWYAGATPHSPQKIFPHHEILWRLFLYYSAVCKKIL